MISLILLLLLVVLPIHIYNNICICPPPSGRFMEADGLDQSFQDEEGIHSENRKGNIYRTGISNRVDENRERSIELVESTRRRREERRESPGLSLRGYRYGIFLNQTLEKERHKDACT